MKNSLFALVALLLLSCGCKGEPTIYPVSGKVTLGGECHSHLIVHMRPKKGIVTRHNLGVGETDANGVLTFGSGAGDGIAAGDYRVSFSYYPSVDHTTGDAPRKRGDSPDGKKDGARPRSHDIVPAPYNSTEDSPVEFTVTSSGENYFEFDIPSDRP